MAPPSQRQRIITGRGKDSEQVAILDSRDSRNPTRVSMTGPPTSLESEVNYSDEDVSDGHGHSISPPRTQYELARDGDYEHLEHADEDFQRATQRFRSRDVSQGDNRPAESGIVERIECINFMCHDKLVVELGPLINFIVGENGSGKSAVLTALTLCLGGKASSTNRGGNLKSFIKEGRDHSSLAVRIKNQGPDAFQPESYGSSITVERHFSRTGTSGFKVKTALGKIMSTKKAEVDDISEWYCLQMDNPLNVLSQDNARQFLNSSTPAQKYKFFVQGVQLEQLDNDYKIVMETSQELEDRRDALVEAVTTAENVLLAAERLREVVSKNAEMREKARHYINQLSWAQVAEQERTLVEREQAILDVDERITAAGQAIEEKTHMLDEADAHLETAKKSLSRLQAEASGFYDAVAEAEDAYKRAKFDLQSLHTEERDVYGRLKNADNTLKNIEQKMREEERRLNQASRTARSEKEAELEAAKNEESTFMSKCREMKEKIPSLELRRDEEKKVLEDFIAGQFKPVSDEICRSKDHIESLKRDTGSVYDGMPPGVKRLVERVSEATTFNQKPVGPLGAHIQLLKPEWAELIQTYLKGSLTAFVVTSLADQRRLADMMADLRLDCNIIISNGHRLQIRDELDAAYETIFRVLEFDNELVRDQLIINNFIDQTILMTERPKAADVVKNASGLKGCLTYMNAKHLRGSHLTKSPTGLVNSRILVLYKGQPLIKADGEAQIQLEQKRMSQLAQDLGKLQQQQRRMQQELRNRDLELDRCKADVSWLQQQVLQVQVRILDLQEQLDAFEGVDGRLNGLRDELSEWRAAKETIGEQYGGMNLEKKRLHEKVEEHRLKLTSARTDKETLNNKIHKAQGKVRQCEDTRRLTLAEKNNAYESRDMAIGQRARYNTKHDDQKKVVEQFTAQALECCPYRVHISEDETFLIIQQKYKSLKTQLKQREKAQGATDQEINERAEKAKETHDDVKRSKTVIETELNLIKLSLNQRIEKWRRFQRQITARTRVQFLYLLSERGYRGDLQIDHRGRKLALEVEPDQTQRRAAGRNTKTLSGGEKSFSSICMLLAIWEAMGSPIRCLDEFDVFMDNVNRAISTNMLIKAARTSVTRQYILITPNAIEGRAKLDKDVKIIRLTDPRQKTLPVMVNST